MKKLKIALTLLFALSCSLFLFACGGGEKEVSEIVLEGGKKTFVEGEDFSVGDLKVSVYYVGSDDLVELTAEEYEVDPGQYDKTNPSDYTITVIPLNQPESLFPEGGTDNRVKKTYTVTVDHNWVDDGGGSRHCACGAKEVKTTGLNDQVITTAWANQATLIPGEGAAHLDRIAAPIAGENHVSGGTLVQGQSLRLSLRIDATDETATWNTPLIGIRDGADGLIPREDAHVIGVAAGFDTPEGGTRDAAATAGEATTSSTPWIVYTAGDTWNTADLSPSGENKAIDEIYWNYRMDGIMVIRHTLTKADGSVKDRTLSIKVPDSGYELVIYGEKVTFTITEATYVENREVTGFDATLPTTKVFAEGKMFDKTGVKTTVTFTEGKGDPIVGEGAKASGNFYAYVGTGEAETKVNIGTEPLQAGMHDFSVEFGGKTHWFTKNGEKGGEDEIRVVPTLIAGAQSVVYTEEGVAFESPNATYDYAVTTDEQGIRLVVTGAASKLTAEQGAKLTGATHFVAFRLLGFAAGAFDKATTEAAGVKMTVVEGEEGKTNIDVLVPLGESTQNFSINFTKHVVEETPAEGDGDPTRTERDDAVGSVLIDLAGVDKSATLTATVTNNQSSINAGGVIEVTYTGTFTADTANGYKLKAIATSETVANIKAAQDAVPGSDTLKGKRVTATFFILNDITVEANKIVVKYWLGAPTLANLTANDLTKTVELRDSSDNVLVSANIELGFKGTETADTVAIGNDVYAKAVGDKLYVFKAFELNDIRDTNTSFDATLNLESKIPYSYNVGVQLVGGTPLMKDANDIASASATRFVILGTVNNKNDYDHGAVLLMEVNVALAGIRVSDKAAVYHFTANEDTVTGNETYRVFTVTGNAITAEEKTASTLGNRTSRQDGNCVIDDVKSFAYTYGTDQHFYFGAIIVPATGIHHWHAKADAENVETCDECGYTRDVEKDGTITRYTVHSTETEYEVVNYDWWAGHTGEVRKLSGDFILEYTYTHADGTGDWSNARFQIYSASTLIFDNATSPNVTIDLGNVNDTALAHDDDFTLLSGGEELDVEKSFTADGEAAPYMLHGEGKGEFNGSVTVTITRIDTVLKVVSAWTSPSGKHYVGTSIIKNFTRNTVTAHISGYGAAVTGLKSRHGEITEEYNNTSYTQDQFQAWGQPVPRTYQVAKNEKLIVTYNWNSTAEDFAAGDFSGAVVNILNLNGNNYFFRPDAEAANSTIWAWRPAEVTFDQGKDWGLVGHGFDATLIGKINASKKDGKSVIEISLQNNTLTATFRFFENGSEEELARFSFHVKDIATASSYRMELAIDGAGFVASAITLETQSLVD